MLFKIKQKDIDGFNQVIEVSIIGGRLILNIFFFKEKMSLGQSSLNFLIENNKVNWKDPVWINEKTMAICDKLLLIKAFA